MWWKMWKQCVLPSLLPYYRWEESRRHRNLREGDFCLLLFESKVLANYRLCRVLQAEPSEDGCVRTVTVGYLPRKAHNRVAYHPMPLEQKEVAIQRLVLILPIEEQGVKEQAASDAQGGDNSVQSFSFHGIQGQVHPLQSMTKSSLQSMTKSSLQSMKKTFLQTIKKFSHQTTKKASPCPIVGYRDKKASLQMIKKRSPCPVVGYRDKKTPLL